jgi:hypothetical protein
MHDLVCWGVNLIRVVSTTMRADNKRPQLLLLLL